MSGRPTGSTLRQLAAEYDLSLDQARAALTGQGLEAPHPKKRLSGRREGAIRRALARATHPGGGPAEERLTQDEFDLRLIGPLLRKGKVGTEHTTPVENVYGHGLPDDMKARAKERTAEFISLGILEEKVSQGRLHVWLTKEGRALVRRLRRLTREE